MSAEQHWRDMIQLSTPGSRCLDGWARDLERAVERELAALAPSKREREELISQQREDLKAALVFVEGVIRKRYTQYTGDDAVEYLKEHGTLVIDESMKERPAIVLWKRLNAAVMK